MIAADLKTVYRELLEETGEAKEQKHFFENLHFSPLKVRHDIYKTLFYQINNLNFCLIKRNKLCTCNCFTYMDLFVGGTKNV